MDYRTRTDDLPDDEDDGEKRKRFQALVDAAARRVADLDQVDGYPSTLRGPADLAGIAATALSAGVFQENWDTVTEALIYAQILADKICPVRPEPTPAESVSARETVEKALEAAAPTAPKGTWLIVLPASGNVMRHNGKLIIVDVPGASGRAPFIYRENEVAIALDPRAVVLNNSTLARVWQPRDHLAHIHPVARKWFEDNPDVFQPDVRSGLSLIE